MHLAETDQTRAVVHEAGHALIATSRGVAVASIELHGADGAGGARLAQEPPSELDRLWILHGGPQAEEMIFGKWVSTGISSDHDDISLAFEVASSLGVSNPAVMQQVGQFLRKHRVGLELVACRLLEVNTLQGVELDELLQEGLARQ
jgi:ATP-dependent Zn protease